MGWWGEVVVWGVEKGRLEVVEVVVVVGGG